MVRAQSLYYLSTSFYNTLYLLFIVLPLDDCIVLIKEQELTEPASLVIHFFPALIQNPALLYLKN